MKTGDTVRVRKTDITGEIVAVFGSKYIVKFPECSEPILCCADEIEAFRRDDVLTGCIAQSYAETGK
jgi:uncharacterized protein Veg